MTAIHVQEMAHAHAVALWDELAELIASGKDDIGSDALELFERKIIDIIDECADLYSDVR